MYYVVTSSHSDKPGLDVLARCKTIRGAAQRLEQERREYYRLYGSNTIFPARPWLQKGNSTPREFSDMSAYVAIAEYEAYRDARNWGR